MKKTILILLLLISVVSFGQIPLGQGYTKSSLRYTYRAFGADSGFHVPYYLGAPSGVRTGVWNGSGNLGVDSTNGRFYFRNNNAWTRVANYSEIPAAIDTSNKWVNRIYRTAGVDSFYHQIGSTIYGVKDSTGGSAIDTSNKWVNNIYRTAGVDSIYYQIGSTAYAIKDSAGGGSGDTLYYSSSPSEWLNQQSIHNPVIKLDMVTETERSVYVPSPIRLNNGDIWVYTKGDLWNRIYGFKSTNNGESFTYEGIALDQSVAGWDSSFVLEPYALYDSATDVIRLYYMGGRDYPYPDFGIGLATASGATPMTFTKDPGNPILSNASFQAQMGIGYETGYIGLSSIVKKDTNYYFHGGWLNGNTAINQPNLRTRLWVGYSNSLSTISNIDSIIVPLDSIQVGVKAPSVWKEGGEYKMIYSKGDPYFAGGYLKSSHSSDLITWTEDDGVLAFPVGNIAWDSVEIYSSQILKKPTGNYDEPVIIYQDSAYGYPLTDQTYGYYLLYFSGSRDSTPVWTLINQTGLMKLYPQKSTMRYAISNNGEDINLLQRNTTVVLNVPTASATKTGKLSSTDWNTFNNKADSSGQWSYIGNTYTQETGKYFNIGRSGVVGRKLTVGGVDSIATLTADAYLNPSTGVALVLKNANNFGISKQTTVGTQITDLWTGTGIGYLLAETNPTYGFLEKFYRKAYQGVFYGANTAMTVYGQAADTTSVNIVGTWTPGIAGNRTTNGYGLNIGFADYFDATAADRKAYGLNVENSASRQAGSNNVINTAARFKATGGQSNYAIITEGGNVGIGTATPTSLLHLQKNSIGVTQSDNNGYLAENTTEAAAGAQQLSPGFVWAGKGWKTDATAASRDVRFRADVLPVQGAVNPSGTWQLAYSINGGAYANAFTVGTDGNINSTVSNAVTHASTGSSYTPYFVAGTTGGSIGYRLTNGGGDLTSAYGIIRPAASTSGLHTMYTDVSTGDDLMFGAFNASNVSIIRAGISITNLDNTAGSEDADLVFKTQAAGAAMSEKLRISNLGATVLSGRLQGKQGADVASATNLTLGDDGSIFEITGTTQIDLITNTNWQNGSEITLMFTSTPTVKNGIATSGSNITILLAGAVDFVASANDVLTLVLGEIGGTQAWREKSRSVN